MQPELYRNEIVITKFNISDLLHHEVYIMLLNVIQLPFLSFPITQISTSRGKQQKQNFFILRSSRYLLIEICMHNYQEEKIWIPLTCLTLQHFHACLMPGPGIPTLMSWSFWGVQRVTMRGGRLLFWGLFGGFSEWRWEVVVCCFDIVRIVDHHCLSFIFISVNYSYIPWFWLLI